MGFNVEVDNVTVNNKTVLLYKCRLRALYKEKMIMRRKHEEMSKEKLDWRNDLLAITHKQKF